MFTFVHEFKCEISRSALPVEEMATHNNCFLNYKQLSMKCNTHHQEMRKSRLEILSLQCKLNKLGKTLDMHQRFLLNISNNDIPRLKELVSVALRNKHSVSYIVSKVVDAIDGVYLARPSQDDKDLTYLILQFGGPALLDICHRANAFPSSSTAYRMAKEQRDIDCSIDNTAKQCLQKNTSQNRDNSSRPYVNPHLSYDGKTDEIKGLCYQHGSCYKSFSSYEEAEILSEAVKNSTVHVPKECLVISGCAMNKTSPSDIMLAWPTCDKKDFQGTYDHFENQLSNQS